MNNNLIINNILRFIFLILLQILVLNNVYIGQYVTPYVYIMFILMLPVDMNKILLIVLSFIAGLTVDIFSNTLGFHTFAATLLGFLRVTFADKILDHNENTVDTPSIRNVPFAQFSYYVLLLTGIYNLVYFSIEAFNFREIFSILLSTVINTLITYLLILLLQVVFSHKKK